MTTTTTITTEEKYRVLAPESMQETFMSDSEDEGGKFIEYIVYTLKFIEHIGYTKFIEYVTLCTPLGSLSTLRSSFYSRIAEQFLWYRYR